MGFAQWQRKEQRSQQKDGGRSRRPPPYPGISFDSVPKWERKFCSQISWREFCEKKRLIHLFPKVLEWDDFAGKEAFDNAKARYWAEINGLPCEIPVPDPDMYIDEIDYYARVDPWLTEALYRLPPPPPPERGTPGIDSITPTGWDVVDPSPAANIPEFIYAVPPGSNDCLYSIIKAEVMKIVPTGWGDKEDSETNSARELRGRETNGACRSNKGSSEDQCGGWQLGWRNDNLIAREKSNSSEHQDNSNRIGMAAGLMKIVPTGWGDEGVSETRKREANGAFSTNRGSSEEQLRGWQVGWGNDHQDNINQRRRDEGSMGSKYTNQRCNGHGYAMNNWNKYEKEQCFWHQPSLDRELHCAHNY